MKTACAFRAGPSMRLPWFVARTAGYAHATARVVVSKERSCSYHRNMTHQPHPMEVLDMAHAVSVSAMPTAVDAAFGTRYRGQFVRSGSGALGLTTAARLARYRRRIEVVHFSHTTHGCMADARSQRHLAVFWPRIALDNLHSVQHRCTPFVDQLGSVVVVGNHRRPASTY